MKDRQLATALYLIDKVSLFVASHHCFFNALQLALRAGGEKDSEEQADTVGCCSLRLEHISESTLYGCIHRRNLFRRTG